MERTPVTRRSFLFSATATVFLAGIPGCGLGEPRRTERERRAFSRMARLLFPHDALADDLYIDVVRQLRAKAADDPALAIALRDGLEELDGLVAGEWMTAPLADQIEALRQVQGEPFFATVQAAVREELYEHPEVWRLIGYGGPSVGQGGYLNRGFDDIDWLPEA